MDRIAAAIWSHVASIGWHLLAIAVSLWYISPYLKGKYLQWKKEWEEKEYSAKYHKDPDMFQERVVALDACRQRMQQEYSVKAASVQSEESRSKQKQKLVVRNLDKGLCCGGDRLGRRDENNCEDDPSETSGAKPKSFKSEYNPLMGDGARGYRPPKRTCCRKGGCG